jgi:hypothetical protein
MKIVLTGEAEENVGSKGYKTRLFELLTPAKMV